MDAQFGEYLDTMQKQNDGLLLALQASAEVMQRLDNKLEKMEHYDDEKREKEDSMKEEEELEKAKNTLVEETAGAVVELMKKENMELHGDTFRKVSHKDVFNQGGGVNDAQSSPDLVTETGEVQKPLQAMLKSMTAKEYQMLQKHFLKEHANMYEHDEVEDMASGDVAEDVLEADEELGMNDDFEKDMGNGEMEMDMGMEDDMEPANYPVEEDDYEKMYKSLKKSYNQRVQGEARKMAEATLKKQGWNKEINRQPRRMSEKTMGLEKSQQHQANLEADLISQIKDYSEKSFKEICDDYMPNLSKSITPMGDNLLELYS